MLVREILHCTDDPDSDLHFGGSGLYYEFRTLNEERVFFRDPNIMIFKARCSSVTSVHHMGTSRMPDNSIYTVVFWIEGYKQSNVRDALSLIDKIESDHFVQIDMTPGLSDELGITHSPYVARIN